VKVCAIGNKAAGFFSRFGGDMVGQVTHLGDTPSINDLIGTVKIMLEMFDSGEVDEVHLVYNQFVNSMTQTPTFEQLLPVVPSGEDELRHHWDYIYEPEAKDVLDELLTRYIESLVFQGVVENTASEQSARMVAMKSASDNAGKLIDELQLIYNKARQAAITQELSEIVAGAAAV
jgi:F-type H+-transporting ATPase subunit gamma